MLFLLVVIGCVSIGVPALAEERTTVYYFHGTYRCETCLVIETAAATALAAAFLSEFEAGRLSWRPVNIDVEENAKIAREHSAQRNDLLMVTRDDSRVGAIVLTGLWELADSPKAVGERVVAAKRHLKESLRQGHSRR